MDIAIIVPLLSSLVCFVLMVLVLLSQRSRVRNAFIVALSFSVVRSFSSFMLHAGFFPEQAIWWYGALTISVSVLIVSYYNFVRAFANKPPGWVTYFGYSMGVVLVVLSLSGIYMQHVDIKDGFVYVEENMYIYYANAVFILSLDVGIFYELIKRYRSLTEPVARNQTGYLLVAFTLSTLFGLSNAVPFLRGYPVDQIGVFLFYVIITYAIIMHQLLDLTFIFRRVLAFGAMAVLFLATFTLWLYLAYVLSDRDLNFTSVFLVALLTVAGAAIYWDGAQRFIHERVDRIFYGESYRYRTELLGFVERRTPEVFSLDEFGRELLVPLAKALDCKQVYLLLPNAISGDFGDGFTVPDSKEDSLLSIRRDSPIVKWLEQKNRCLSQESLDLNPEFRGMWGEERSVLREFDVRLLFPLISRGCLIGILVLSGRRVGSYSLDDVNLVDKVVAQVAGRLEKQYLQEQLRKREQELTLINRLDRVITSSLNIQEVYDAFVTGLKDVMDVDWATIIWVDAEDIQFGALSSEVGSAWQAGERIPLKGTATEWVVRNKKALVESDLMHKSRFWTGAEFVKLGIRSIVYLPLLSKGAVIGSLILASRRPDAYSTEQVDLLDRLAHQIAVSVENSRLYTRAEQRARVDELTRLFNRRHFDECLRREIGMQSRAGGVASLVFLDLDLFKDYNDKYGHLDGDKILARIAFVIEKSIRDVDLAFRYGGDEFAILLPGSVGKDAFAVAERVRSKIGSAMKEEQAGITASLGLASWPSDGVTPDDIVTAADRALYYAKRTGGDRTCLISEMVPSASEHAMPGTKAEKEALSIIYALASTIEARDQYTYGHSRNVSRYAVALAESLGLPSDKVTVIGTAALLHDIGKIGISDEVLNKAEKLTDDEWRLIQSHPKLSAAIVGHVLSLTPCLPAVLHHQERWDGKGYPSGLKGESIPLEARILSVADAFEAMTSPRPYRGAKSGKEALEELRRNAGRQFDPKIVDSFLPIALSWVAEQAALEKSGDVSKVD